MLLQPADFYSYSRATGTKPPENDRERAAVAADVIDFKRSQLKAPSPDSDEGRDIGLVALGAGILGSIIGGKKISERFRGPQTPPKKISFDVPPETKQVNKRVAKRNNQKLVKDLNEVKPSKIVESPTVVEKAPVETVEATPTRVRPQRDVGQEGGRYDLLMKSGLPKVDIDTRVEAYVSSGDLKFLNPAYNPLQVGADTYIQSFAKAGTPLVKPQFNERGQLTQATTINIPGAERGEIKRGIGGVDTPTETVDKSILAQDIQLAEEGIGVKYLPQAPKTVVEGEDLDKLRQNVLRASQVEGEQFGLKRQEWTKKWDQLYSDPASFVTKPREELRVVTKEDLSIPALGDQTFGEVLLKKNPEAVKDILEGKPRELQVPFQVNKQKAINALEQAEATKSPNIKQLRSEVLAYVDTGKALSGEYQKIVGPVADSARVDFIPEDSRVYKTVRNVGGKPNITPEFQTKGQLVGGTTEPLLSESLYALKYKSTPRGPQIADLQGLEVKDIKEADLLKTAQGKPLKVSAADQQNFVMMQSMGIDNVEPVIDPKSNLQLQATRKTQTGKLYQAPLFKISQTKVNAPLQILETATGKDLTGKVKLQRNVLLDATYRAQGSIKRKGGIADYGSVAKELNTILEKEKGITLPVLQSYDNFDFIESLVGKPASRPARFMYATKKRDGTLSRVVKNEQAEFAKMNNLPVSTVDLSRPREATDVTTFDKKEQYKTDRLEMADTFDERFLDAGARELGSARRSSRPADIEQRQKRAQFELQQKQIDIERGKKITGTDKQVPDFTENLNENIQNIIQTNLAAQGKRRAAKRRKK
jgi:hypothetical protein